MELEELIPERVQWSPKFKDNNNNEKTVDFYFRPFNLEDESWMKREFGEKQLKEIFEGLQMDKIARIAFRQLELDSKRNLMDIKFVDMDEDGEEVEIALKGPDKLGYFISGLPDQLNLVQMLLRTRGVSMPIIEKVGKRMLEESQTTDLPEQK